MLQQILSRLNADHEEQQSEDSDIELTYLSKFDFSQYCILFLCVQKLALLMLLAKNAPVFKSVLIYI